MVGIIDYGAGNLNSVLKAVNALGYDAKIISTNQELNQVDAYILPGVGSFGSAMENIAPIKETLIDNIKNGKYVLGICLGMQMLFDKSYEDGEFDGLSLLKGNIKKLEVSPLKVPHMGWNELVKNGQDDLIQNIKGYVYFVHSYYADVDNFDCVKLYSEYGIKVPAMVRNKNIIGMQFHPEKSGETGMALLKNFLEMIKC